MEYKLWRINNYGQEEKLSFTNFELLNLANESIVLRDLLQDNDYIVLYFWFAGCGPCRAFNEKITEKLINELRQNKIELISIGTDFNKSSWQKASEQDAIFWRNLYGGHVKDDIEIAYRIRGYPTKVIFNKKLELVDFKFIRPEELLELVKSNK
jgi:thiol-disulfide isomerase/thioredoxin